jgi:hypothetical protein
MREVLHEVTMERLTFNEKCKIGFSAALGVIGAYYVIKYLEARLN